MKLIEKLMIVFACLLITPLNAMSNPQKMIVKVGVADLRSRPEHIQSGLQGPAFSKDIGAQDSQVLFGESVIGEDVPDKPEWVKVIIQTQKNWNGKSWTGYPGYLIKSSLKAVSEFSAYNVVLQNLWTPLYDDMDQSSPCNFLALGTRLEAQRVNADWWRVIIDKKVCGYLKADDDIYEIADPINESEDSLREKIIRAAHLLMTPKTPYVWGGRSPLWTGSQQQITGIDCSGLSSLAYLAAGLEIPRDSSPQYRFALPVAHGNEMKKADLIFFARGDGPQTSHVMIYDGDGHIVESFGDGVTSISEAINKGLSKDMFGVRKVAVKEALGIDIDSIESGKTVAKNGKKILLATYFGKNGKATILRAAALGKLFYS